MTSSASFNSLGLHCLRRSNTASGSPDAANIGLLYCANEANSQYQVDTVQAELEKLGYACTQYAFSDSNDVSAELGLTPPDDGYVPLEAAEPSAAFFCLFSKNGSLWGPFLL